MVGVAGRSRGCRTCRRRKKGCDLEQPICRNCRKTNNHCEYDRRHVFINVTRPGAGAGTPAANGVVPSTTDVTLPHSLARSAYEDKYVGLFWDIWFPCERPSADCSSKYPISNWTLPVMGLYQQDNALRRTLLALCLGTIGQKDNQPWLTTNGFQCYVQALSEANAGLRHPKRWKSDAMLVASCGLGLFELLYGMQSQTQLGITQVRSWQSHTLGELALVQQRGPESYIDGYGHRHFVDARMHLAIAGCMSRKKNFLSDVAWKTVPWTKIPKTPKDVLLDILVDVPTLLEEADLLQRTSEPDIKIVQHFIKTYQRLDQEMVWWLENLSPPSQLLDDLRKRNYRNPTADELAVAHVMTYFWAACILVYSSIHMAAFSSPALFKTQTVELTERTDPRPYCIQIADTVEVFFQPEAGTFGMFAAPFPIGMATKYLMFTEGLASEDCMKLISYFGRQNGGAAMGDFLRNSLPEWVKNESVPSNVKLSTSV